MKICMTVLLCAMVSACADNDGSLEEGTLQPAISDTEVQTEQAEDDALFPSLNYTFPEADYGGEVFRILTRNAERFNPSEMDANETDGDTINDAIYYRNLAVEERYNVSIEAFSDSTEIDWHGPQYTERLILAGDSSVDMITGSCLGMMRCSVSNLFYNLNALDRLDLTEKCWSQELLDRSTIHGQTFVASGSIALHYFKSVYALALNRPLCQQFDISVDALYEQVMNGDWTMDDMIRMTQDIYQDVNGNGAQDADDIYGCGILLNCMNDGWWSACDISMATTDADGNLRLDVNLDKLETVNEKLRNYVWVSGGVLPMSEDVIMSREITAGMNDNPFYEDKLCMTTIRIGFTEAPAMRNMASDFGIVPYPKFDENQKEYYSYIHDAFSVVMIPISCEDAEMAATVMQALAVEGHNTVMPAYYDVVLSEKYMRDRASVEMLNIIFNSVTLDTGWLFSGVLDGAPQALLREQVWANVSTLQSTYTKHEKQIRNKIEEINAAYRKISEEN